MRHQNTEYIAQLVIAEVLIPKLNQQIKMRELLTHTPEYTAKFVKRMNDEYIYLDNFSPSLRNPLIQEQVMLEDRGAQNIYKDQLANYNVDVQKTDTDILKREQKSLYYQRNSLGEIGMQTAANPEMNRRTASTHKRSSKRGQLLSRGQSEQINQRYFKVPLNPHQSPEKLWSKQISQEQFDMQVELRAIQTRLYEGRKFKQQSQERQRIRLQEIANRRMSNRQKLPNRQFTYSFDGNFLKKKISKDKQSFTTPVMSVQHSYDLKQLKKKSNSDLLNEEQTQRGRSQLHSRYRKAEVFNNANKRQISHLPFIKMSDNAMLKQYAKVSQGNKTQRISFKGYAETNEQNGFKHHHQIQKQKKDRELADMIKMGQQDIQKQGGNIENKSAANSNTESTVRRKQSYLLSRYYKKLKEQKIEQNRHSLNFSPTSFPKNTAIHNFYKHNFDNERKNYQSYVITKAIDDS